MVAQVPEPNVESSTDVLLGCPCAPIKNLPREPTKRQPPGAEKNQVPKAAVPLMAT